MDLLFLKNNYLKITMKGKKDLNTSICNVIILSDSKIDIFTDALKKINLTQKAVEAANDEKMLLIMVIINEFFLKIKEIINNFKNSTDETYF